MIKGSEITAVLHLQLSKRRDKRSEYPQSQGTGYMQIADCKCDDSGLQAGDRSSIRHFPEPHLVEVAEVFSASFPAHR